MRALAAGPRRPLRLRHSCVLLGASGLLACSGGEALTGGLEPPARGTLAVTVTGVPDGATPAVTVTGPAGFARALAGSDTLRDLAPGDYHLVSGDLTHQGHTWSPVPADQSVSVTAGRPMATAAIAFEIVTGGLTITVSGLPEGIQASLTLNGPGGASRAVPGSMAISGLTPGSYTLAGPPITVGASTWVPSLPATIVVQAGTAATAVGVTYGRLVGSLDITVSGLPAGISAQFRVAGPGGFADTLTGTASLADLDPGEYTVAADPVQHTGHTWRPSSTVQAVTVAAGATASIPIQYAIATGALTVAVAGLPTGAAAAITVAGPDGFASTATADAAWVGIAPGTYLVTATPVAANGWTWQPAPASQSVPVTAGTTPALAAITYAQLTGALAVSVTGLPGGTAAAVTVTGPGGFNQAVTATRSLTGLVPGSYTVSAAGVVSGGHTWAPSPASRSVSVPGGGSASAGVAYTQTTGSLSITVTGLPTGTGGTVTVSGPGGFSQQVTGTTTIPGLAPGTYAIAAAPVTSGGSTWNPAPSSQTAAVTATTTAAAPVSYALVPPPPPPPTLNLRIDGMYLTQAAQRYDGSAPLVAGRAAYLRVFALASVSNSAAPAVRVRFYSGTTLVQTQTIPAPGSSVPVAASEASLTSSWNVLVPGSLVQPGLRVVADVDPSATVPESNEADNAFPSSGAPAALDVRALPAFALRFVPVLQQANGLQGNVADANKEQFLADTRAMLPVAGSDADVRAPYTTSAPALQSDNANGAWGTILSEVLALRSADGNSRYYYGVVRTTYTSGVAGIGYVGGGARTALGWDRLPSGSGVMAHELGHNMGRSHAPCGGVGSPDPSFPHAGGGIGIWGLDVGTLTLKSPATFKDLMSYCSPEWISDYNWSAMVSYRQGGPNNTVGRTVGRSDGQTVGRSDGQGLLVWGRITPSGLVLEPAFAVDAPIALPVAGAHRLELVGLAGEILRSIPFRAVEVHDLPGGREEAFAFVLPLDRGTRIELAAIRLVSSGRVVERRINRTEPVASVALDPRGGTLVRWNVSETSMLLVRDAATGQILSFARGGEVRVPTLPVRVRVSRPEMR